MERGEVGYLLSILRSDNRREPAKGEGEVFVTAHHNVGEGYDTMHHTNNNSNNNNTTSNRSYIIYLYK